MGTEIGRVKRYDGSAWWALAGVIFVLVPAGALSACAVQPREGWYACSRDDQCPSGWVCQTGRCYSRRDAGTDPSGDLSDADVAQEADADGPRTCNNPGECDDLNPCTIDSCIGGFCGYAWEPDGFACEDGVFCNGADVCMSGLCRTPGDPCRPGDTCDETNARCLCDDTNPCTGPDVRQSDGTCQGPNADGTLCGTCDAGGCRICCGGSCVTSGFDHCAGCGSCSFSCGPCMQRESCVFSSTRACAWDWCCACPC